MTVWSLATSLLYLHNGPRLLQRSEGNYYCSLLLPQWDVEPQQQQHQEREFGSVHKYQHGAEMGREGGEHTWRVCEHLHALQQTISSFELLI